METATLDIPTDISPNFPFESRYIDVLGSKIHYIDEGEGDPILFIHGNPTSSYLWRNIIPHVQGQGRCIALDLIGMGKSDKPDIEYGFESTYRYLEAFIEKLSLQNITLVIHDWGSGLGFHYANTHRDNIKGIAFMEAMYKPVDFGTLPFQMRFAMRMMRAPVIGWVLIMLFNMFITKMLPDATGRKMSAAELAYYAAPYKTTKSRKPIRIWPREVPINGTPAHTHKVVTSYHEWLKTTEIPKIHFYSDPGLLIPKEDAPWIKENFPNTESVGVGSGLHFMQEDQPHRIGKALSTWHAKL